MKHLFLLAALAAVPAFATGGALKITCSNADGKLVLAPSAKHDQHGEVLYHVWADAAIMTDSLGQLEPDDDYDTVPVSFNAAASAREHKDVVDGDGCGVCGIDLTFPAGTLAHESVTTPAFAAHLHSYYSDIADDEKDVDLTCKFEAP